MNKRFGDAAPQRTRLALAVGCALAFSWGGTQIVHADGGGGLPEGMDSVEMLSFATYGDMAAVDDDIPFEQSINLWAEEDELIRAVASGELDPALWQDEFAAFEVITDPASEPPVVTATRVVTNCEDSGPGSLRAILQESENNDVIDMSSLTCGTITLDSFLIVAPDNLTLKGSMSGSPGKYLRLPIINASDDNTTSLMRHSGNGTLKLEKLTLQNGAKYGAPANHINGGCIMSTGAVSLTDVTITGCVAKDDGAKTVQGGAVYAETGITLTRSRVSSSKARSGSGPARGGALYTPGSLTLKHSTLNDNAVTTSGASHAGGAWSEGSAWIERSTVSGNTAALSAGVHLTAGAASIRIKSSTFSGNTSTGTGSSGGAYLSTTGPMRISNSTFTNNATHGVNGPGIYATGAPVELTGNIISGNRALSGAVTYYRDAHFQVPATGSNNLIGWLGPNSASAPADTVKQVNTPLTALKNNGGHTMTHAPKKGSWAFNHGKFTPDIIGSVPGPGGFPVFIFEPHTDQTDAPRTVGAGIDIGSFESDALFIGRFDNKPLL